MMEGRQNPFSLYDFLGYFIPGAVALYFFCFAYFHVSAGSFGPHVLKKTVEFFQYEIYLPFIIVSYIVGHLLSFLSSITVEKYSIWSNGYPSKYILGAQPKGYFYATENPLRRIIGRLFVGGIILFPITFFDIVLGRWLNLRQLYMKECGSSKTAITAAVRKLFRIHGMEIGEHDARWFDNKSFFRLCYHHALENSGRHALKIQNYVALYGFSRTLTLLFVLLFWLFVRHALCSRFPIPYCFTIPFALAFISYLYYVSFNKFYRRYSLETLMALTVATEGNGNGS